MTAVVLCEIDGRTIGSGRIDATFDRPPPLIVAEYDRRPRYFWVNELGDEPTELRYGRLYWFDVVWAAEMRLADAVTVVDPQWW